MMFPGRASTKSPANPATVAALGGVSGAPKMGDKEEWAPLIRKGIPELIKSSLDGFGDMKAKDGCETCTDSDVIAAIEYMVEQSR